jgi:hypothetical protein
LNNFLSCWLQTAQICCLSCAIKLTAYRYVVHDVPTFGGIINGIENPGGFVVAPRTNIAQDIADSGFHAASAPFYKQTNDNAWLDRLDNALSFPWDQDMLHDRFELAAPRDCAMLT